MRNESIASNFRRHDKSENPKWIERQRVAYYTFDRFRTLKAIQHLAIKPKYRGTVKSVRFFYQLKIDIFKNLLLFRKI